jgi:hypothetical protein
LAPLDSWLCLHEANLNPCHQKIKATKIRLGANQILDISLVETPRCGVRSAQRADPTKN